jgi:hypothetical protein
VNARRIRLLIVAIALCAPGCSLYPKIFSRDPFGPKAACALPPEATKEEIVLYLNKNILGENGRGGVTGWRAKPKVYVKGIPVGADADLAVAAPRNLRMRVYEPLSGNAMMDLGSNDEHFWLWTRDQPDQRNDILKCRHEDFGTAITELNMRLPFHPDWMMEVFGVVPLDPSEFTVERPFENSPIVDLVAQRHAPTGEPVLRVIRINACHGLVLEHQLRRQGGTVIARAILSGHYKQPDSLAIVPKQIRLEWPELDEFIVLKLNEIDVNAGVSDDSQMWTMNTPPGSQVVDLGDMARSRGVPGEMDRSREVPYVQLDEIQRGGGSNAAESGMAAIDTGDSEAPAWGNVSPATDGNPKIDLSMEGEDWQTPESRVGRVDADEMEFEVPESSRPATTSPWAGEPTIRMQSSESSSTARHPNRSRFFNWLFPRRDARPAAYSSKASQSSSVRPRLGLE